MGSRVVYLEAHFGAIFGALGHHFAIFDTSVATLVGRMADASTWVKMGFVWGGRESHGISACPNSLPDPPSIQGRYTQVGIWKEGSVLTCHYPASQGR